MIKSRGLIKSGTDRKKILLRTNLVLLGALILMIFIVPLIPANEHYLTRLLFCVVVASGLFAADFSKRAFRILSTFGTMVIMITLLNLFSVNSENLGFIVFFLNTMFFILVTIALIAHVAGAREVYASTLLCAINSYLLIGLTFSILFIIINMQYPDSFTEVEWEKGSFATFIYYGFVTLTTLGYGDITPDSALARSLSNFTSLFGQLYLVIIMALIIGKYLNSGKVGDPGNVGD